MGSSSSSSSGVGGAGGMGSSSSSSSSSGGCGGPPAGTLLDSSCSGAHLYGTYADGNCGTYQQVIQYNAPECCPASGTFVNQYCQGYALWANYTNGTCGTYAQEIQACSAQCGAPSAGTLVSQACVGADLVGTYNDGNCSTYTQVIQANSPSCAPPATCSDGTQNQGETGVDCGGPCPACGPFCGDGTCDSGETCGNCTADCPMPTQYSFGRCEGTSWVYYYGFNGCWALNYIQTYDDSAGAACGAGGFSAPTTVCDTVFTITLPEAEACGGACTGSFGAAPCDCNWLGSYSQAGYGQQPGFATPVCN